MKNEKGRLFLVTNHIGNKKDLTFRAKDSLQICDTVLCEDIKIGARTLRDINLNKNLEELSKSNEEEKSIEIIERLKNGERIALISDAGMPVFADPGSQLMKAAINAEIDVELVPGVTSIMTALVRSGFDIEEFLYAGFLSRKAGERLEKLERLSKEKRTVAFLETPYRLVQVLEGCAKVMPNRNAYIGMNLTMFNETHHYGTFKELSEKFTDSKVKAEFVICFEGAKLYPKPDEESRGERFVRKRKFNKSYSEREKPKRGSGPYRGKSDFNKKSEFKPKSAFEIRREQKEKQRKDENNKK